MLIVLTAEIAAGVWAFQNGDKLEAFVKSNFKHTISNEYKVIDSRKQVIDFIQTELKCCGADGPSDWSHRKYNNSKGGSLDLTLTSKLNYDIPSSCCKEGTNEASCEASRKGVITASVDSVIYKTVRFSYSHHINEL